MEIQFPPLSKGRVRVGVLHLDAKGCINYSKQPTTNNQQQVLNVFPYQFLPQMVVHLFLDNCHL